MSAYYCDTLYAIVVNDEDGPTDQQLYIIKRIEHSLGIKFKGEVSKKAAEQFIKANIAKSVQARRRFSRKGSEVK